MHRYAEIAPTFWAAANVLSTLFRQTQNRAAVWTFAVNVGLAVAPFGSLQLKKRFDRAEKAEKPIVFCTALVIIS